MGLQRRGWWAAFGALAVACTSPPGPGRGPEGACPALASAIDKDHLLVGAQLEDDLAETAALDVRYLYLAGGLFDDAEPCASCTQSCSDAWWGCWQDTSLPPGEYVRDFFAEGEAAGQIPWITYYEILHASGVEDGTEEVDAATDPALMHRYFADFRFLLQQIGSRVVFLHLEPDFWGYAQHLADDPRQLPAAVATANAQDCGALENNIAGMGRCLVAMVRKYAPNARVGLHASAWSSQIDVMINDDASLDVAAEAAKTAAFLVAAGAGEADFVVVEALDRDAGFYDEERGEDRWWDATNLTLPSFTQAFAWTKAISEGVGRPHIWWQLPVGNLSLPNTDEQWKDNRVDYFFDHPQEITAAHGVGMLFGAGEGQQTNPGTDGGHLLSRAAAYAASGGVPMCP